MSVATRFFSGIVIVMLLAVPAWAQSMPSNVKIGEATAGKVLTNEQGMTLYVFKKDGVHTGRSACVGVCAQNWPPLAVPDGFTAGDGWGEITRSDGSKQLTYDGKPLYTFSGDKAPGSVAGDNFKHLWNIARP